MTNSPQTPQPSAQNIAERPKFLWLDLETTGLDPDCCSILELAYVITDDQPIGLSDLKSYQFKFGTARWMEPFAAEMHAKNGLISDCMKADLTTDEAEIDILGVIKETLQPNETLYLAGNSVWFDYQFLCDRMPRLARRLHHRFLDMSAVALFGNTLGLPRPEKKEAHRAAADILESLEYFKHYKRIFMPL